MFPDSGQKISRDVLNVLIDYISPMKTRVLNQVF